ncbi:MAG: CPBP family intramembrane glutamic endopeptidase [Bacillota bacterium]
MTKTFKLGAIFFITILWQVLVRTFIGYLPLSDNGMSWLFSFLIQLVGMGFIPLMLYRLWIGNNIVEGFYLKKKLHPATYVIIFFVGILFFYGTIGVSSMSRNILELFGYTRITTNVGTIYSGWEVLVMQILTVAILPAFFEEFTNRGLIMRIFEHEKNDTKVIFILAIIFALFHQNIIQTIYTFVGGLVLAYMAVKTRNIWPAIIVHFMNNFMSVLTDYSSQTGGVIYDVYSKVLSIMSQDAFVLFASWIVTGLLIAGLLRLMARLNKKNLEQEKQTQIPSDDIYQDIYSVFQKEQKKSQPSHKVKLWEYGMVIAAGVMAFSATVFTFIWGVLR